MRFPVRIGRGAGLCAAVLSLLGAVSMQAMGQVAASHPGLPVRSTTAQSDPLPLAFTQNAFPNATLGVFFNSSVQVIGGAGLLTMTVSGDLPPGLAAVIGANTVAVSGVPTQAGQYQLQISIRDTYGAALQNEFTIQVLPQTLQTRAQVSSPAVIDNETFHFHDAELVFFPAVISVAENFTFTDKESGLDAAVVVDRETITLTDTEREAESAFLVDRETIILTDNVMGLDSALSADKETITLTDSDSFQILTASKIIWPTPAPITYGTALSGTQLDASVPTDTGTLVYTPPAGTILPAGVNTLSVSFTPSAPGLFTSATATVQLTVNQATQTISFPAITATEYAATTLDLSATATSGLTVAFASTTPTYCTVSGATASLLISGICTIQATQAGNSNYSAAPMVQQSFAVHHQTQTISFPAIPSQIIGTNLTLSATASSGLPVSFATTTSTVCSVAGTTATMLAKGNCIIQASQAGNGAYAAAPGVSQYFAVSLPPQTITFPAITGNEVAATKISLTATASSGLTVAFASTTPTVCTVSGTTASLLIAGSCGIQATQAGNSSYAPAPAVTQSFVVHHNTQTITFPAIPSQVVGAIVTLSATASSGLPVSFATTTSTVCSVAGTTATMLATGNCVIQASQAGNGAYAVAPGASQYFVVKKAQTITFPAITATEVATTTLGLSATSSSGLTVAFASTTPTICTVAGTTASLLIAGTCTIQATQAGNSVYGPAPMVSQSFAVHHETQTITFPQIASQVVGAQVTLTATASSGLAVSFATTTPTVCSVSGTMSPMLATMLATGNCVIQASQAGNAAYAVAPGVSQYFAVKAN